MRAAHYAAMLAFPLLMQSAPLRLGSSLFVHFATDMAFTHSLLFSSPSPSPVACARLCDLHPRCLTFTFHQGTCQGHWTALNSTSPQFVAMGAVSYRRQTEADLVRCRANGEQRMIVPSLGLDTEVVCQGDWMVILRRQDGSVDFYRDWNQYKTGFGSLEGEFWIGLDNLHQITSTQSYMLAVELEDWEGQTASALYANFSVGSEQIQYQLHVDFVGGDANDSLTWHNGHPFSTHDNDNDDVPIVNCADKLHGAWWYNSCAESNLCGHYKHNSSAPDKDGLSWKWWKGTTNYSMKTATMKISPA